MAAAARAEAAEGLPAGLLLAIGRTESGRYDPGRNRIVPWPWSVDESGVGRFFATREEAVARVAERLAAGVRSIDVGCFQVNLMYHPSAFASLAEAFEPDANARYAAGFLARLYRESGDWTEAVRLYHSANPALGVPYGQAVLASWRGGAFGFPAAFQGVRPVRAPAGPVLILIPGQDSRVRWLPRVFYPTVH